MRIHLTSMFVILAGASQMGATESGCGNTSILRDPGFDLWCGDVLCSWKTTAGEVRKAPTWHAKDAGVEFVGPGESTIEQVSPVDRGDGHCLRFDLVADVEATAEVRLNVDIAADGSIELSERIPTSDWEPLSYYILVDARYRGMRFELTKRGSGKAVLAQIAAEIARPDAENPNPCEGFTSIVPAPAANGAWCEADAQCASGMCRTALDPSAGLSMSQRCVDCEPGGTSCTPVQVCGVVDPDSFIRQPSLACVSVGSRALGEQCIEDSECANGACPFGICSTCAATGDPCGTGETCGVAYNKGPLVCSPNQHRRTTGEPCASNNDCASNQCNGAVRSQCSDGRWCASPAQCPVENGLEPGACTTVGIQGGTCQ